MLQTPVINSIAQKKECSPFYFFPLHHKQRLNTSITLGWNHSDTQDVQLSSLALTLDVPLPAQESSRPTLSFPKHLCTVLLEQGLILMLLLLLKLYIILRGNFIWEKLWLRWAFWKTKKCWSPSCGSRPGFHIVSCTIIRVQATVEY